MSPPSSSRSRRCQVENQDLIHSYIKSKFKDKIKKARVKAKINRMYALNGVKISDLLPKRKNKLGKKFNYTNRNMTQEFAGSALSLIY